LVIETYTNEMLKAIDKEIQEKIAYLSSDVTNSILKDEKEEIINFHGTKCILYSKHIRPV